VNANDGRQLVAGFQIVHHLAIGQTQERPLDTQNLSRLGGLARPRFDGTVGCRLTVGHVNQMNCMSLADKPRDLAPHPQLLVIRVRAYDENR
jgi:hypothetical protein